MGGKVIPDGVNLTAVGLGCNDLVEEGGGGFAGVTDRDHTRTWPA